MNDTNIPHSKFWQFNIGHLLTLIALLGGLIAFMLRYESRMSQIENTQIAMVATTSRLEATIERMDAQGTYASQRGIMKDTEAVASNSRRIESLESYARDVGPKVERMNANLDWLIQSLKDGGTIKH